jgi:hypothetical protein
MDSRNITMVESLMAAELGSPKNKKWRNEATDGVQPSQNHNRLCKSYFSGQSTNRKLAHKLAALTWIAQNVTISASLSWLKLK